MNRYPAPDRVAIDDTAVIHITAQLGNPPEHRDWWKTWEHGSPRHTLGVRIGPSVRIGPFVTVDAGMEEPTRIGFGSWLMAHVHVAHDVQVGQNCELAPGTAIAGHCQIGDGVRFGVNACVRPFIRIGDGARIGAGAVVVKDVPPGQVWVGNPARQLIKDDLTVKFTIEELTEQQRKVNKLRSHHLTGGVPRDLDQDEWEEWWPGRRELWPGEDA